MLAIALVACQSASGEDRARDRNSSRAAPMRDDAAPRSDTLEVRLDVPAVVASGESVPIEIRIENLTDRRLDLYLTGRDITYDIIVEDESGGVVWNRLHGLAIQEILRVEALAPRDTLVLRAEWDQSANDGGAAPPGRYIVRAELPTDSRPLVSDRVPLQVDR